MEETRVYLRKEKLAALRKAARRPVRSMAELIRHAVRRIVPKRRATGPTAIWDGKPKRLSVEDDSVHEEP
jgi:hypothetical protein